MGKMLSFYGSSDDNFCYMANGKNGDAISCYHQLAMFKLMSNGSGLQVVGRYAPDGVEGAVWVIGIALLDEDVPLPDWPINYTVNENGYSVQLNIDCADDVTVSGAAP